MKNKNGFAVSYNPQTAVDSNTHLIHDFQMTNQVTDHGLLYSTLENIKAENPDRIIETVADKGYENEEDMIKCLENGIIPHVITDDGKDEYELEIDYVEGEVKQDSTKPEEIRKTLHAGQIPKAYDKVIEKMEEMDEATEKLKEKAEETADNVKEKSRKVLKKAKADNS